MRFVLRQLFPVFVVSQMILCAGGGQAVAQGGDVIGLSGDSVQGFVTGGSPLLLQAAQAIPTSHPIVSEFPPGFAHALEQALSDNPDLLAWYAARGGQPVWVGSGDVARRVAFFGALETARDHGLPESRYRLKELRAEAGAAQTYSDLARFEAAVSRAYLTWARDISSGILEPSRIDATIVRNIIRPQVSGLMTAVAGDDPQAALRALLPDSAQYARLQKERFALDRVAQINAWGGAVPMGKYTRGQSGQGISALRARLTAMGYLHEGLEGGFDRAVEDAVLAFQAAHGLVEDGVAGPVTLTELNVPPEERMKSVLVAMERERWMDLDHSGRMIWVNLPDFSTEIWDDGALTFRTRSVIGRQDDSRRTPEFSDFMNHIVINPSWGVPRSITVGEYLPMLKRNSNAVGHLQVVDSKGRVVPRGSVNFAKYTARSFPYSLRQPPSNSNALGVVKFMFPNKYNIYLHDTPAKSLFNHDKRAYSHGCIRLADPQEFARVLLGAQSLDPAGEFNRHLKSGRETRVNLEEHVPVHLVYFTAYPQADGRMGYRRDVYGRDAQLWAALESAGVALAPLTQ